MPDAMLEDVLRLARQLSRLEKIQLIDLVTLGEKVENRANLDLREL